MAETKTLAFCNLSTGYFVEARFSRQVTQYPLGQLFSKDLLKLEVYPLVTNPSAFPTQDPFSQVDVSTLALTFSIFDPTGTLLASTGTFSADAGQNILTGVLTCDTVGMATYLGSALELPIIIEARFVSPTSSRNVRATTVIKRQFNTSGSPSATPGTRYYTADEVNGLIRNLTVESIEWISPDTTKKKIEYLGNDDQMHMDEVT